MNSVDNHFARLGIDQVMLEIIRAEGFQQPTRVQNKALPYVFTHKDVIVSSATGSGKTLIYVLQLIRTVEPGNGVQGMVLVPTRELAKQVGSVLKRYSRDKMLNIMVCYGGGSIKDQKKEVLKADIIVGTPGRISDYVEQKLFQLGHLKTVILDEVDEMVKKCFQNELNYILETTPKNKQTLVFSATISKEVYLIIKNYMKNPQRVFVDNLVDSKKLKQVYYKVEANQKFSLLCHLLQMERAGLVIIFTNRQDTADFLVKNLKRTDLDVRVLHGDMSQGKRNKIIRDFQEEKFDVLICTDVVARGLDIDNVTHIYNYNVPKYSEKYIHRVGRTARAGALGKVINFVSKADFEAFSNIMKEYKISVLLKDLPQFEQIEIKKEYVKKKPRR